MAQESGLHAEVYKLLSTPEAARLANLYLLRGDLNAAYNTLDLYFLNYVATDAPKVGKAVMISRSLVGDDTLLFCSCFSRRGQAKLHPDAGYAHLGKESLEYARKLLDLRDALPVTSGLSGNTAL